MGTTNSQIVEGQNATKLVIDLFKSTSSDNLTVLYLGDFYKKGHTPIWNSLLTEDIADKKNYIDSILLFCIKTFGEITSVDTRTAVDAPGFVTITNKSSTYYINISNVIQKEAKETAEKLITGLKNKKGTFTPNSIAGKGRLNYETKDLPGNKVLFTIIAEIPV